MCVCVCIKKPACESIVSASVLSTSKYPEESSKMEII